MSSIEVSSTACAPAGMPVRRTRSLQPIKERVAKRKTTQAILVRGPVSASPRLRISVSLKFSPLATASGSVSDFDPCGRLFRKRERDFSIRAKQGRAFIQRSFRRNLGQIRIVGALRKMCEHDVTSQSVKAAN